MKVCTEALALGRQQDRISAIYLLCCETAAPRWAADRLMGTFQFIETSCLGRSPDVKRQRRHKSTLGPLRDRIAQHAHLLDPDPADIPRLHPPLRGARHRHAPGL